MPDLNQVRSWFRGTRQSESAQPFFFMNSSGEMRDLNGLESGQAVCTKDSRVYGWLTWVSQCQGLGEVGLSQVRQCVQWIRAGACLFSTEMWHVGEVSVTGPWAACVVQFVRVVRARCRKEFDVLHAAAKAEGVIIKIRGRDARAFDRAKSRTAACVLLVSLGRQNTLGVSRPP